MTERVVQESKKAANFQVARNHRWQDFVVANKTSTASNPNYLTRRDFLKVLGILTGSALLSSCLPGSRGSELELTENEFLPKAHEVDLGDGHTLKIESKEFNLPFSPKQFPDTHTSIFGPHGGYIMYGTSGVKSVKIEGDTLANLSEQADCFGPRGDSDEFGFGGYRGLSGVVGLGGGKLAGLYHEERWPNGEGNGWPFTARIGLAMSEDHGITWTDYGVVMTGDEVIPGSKHGVQGVGQPCAIVTGDNLYTYYTNWPKSGHAKICVAKVPLSEITNPSSWKKFDGSDFNAPGIEGKAAPVLAFKGGADYAALPAISWNTEIGKYLMCFESNKGFYISVAADGFSWTEPQLALEFPMTQGQTIDNPGADWWSYPTMFSDSSMKTGSEGLLLCSHGRRAVTLHRGVLIPWSIT